ncbi:endonuclease/exonuclease/phosphatase family protein [Phytoactinopolyspora mesophila]|uniref:Metal-dependent hydrolase n=1 Tax=Phytoactinopolyspora mesophila TaxID=2650750 RepID=A0A7K3M0K6_9ACTN|nr:endonuclease/exonuclease/phosphatase family protein [Phytoactinopolyspora mesophila]NDL56826.1 metal-dependent hydrolase [Phytoactinopolyspora mesophila]
MRLTQVLRLAAVAALAAGTALGTAATAVTTTADTSDSSPSQAPDRAARVMSFNIQHGVGLDGRLDLQRIADVIETEDADIIGLQEVDRHWSERSDFVDQAAWLARELNMHVVYGANLDRDPFNPGEPRRQYGTAILSNAPILEWDNTDLPRYEGHEQRGLLRARIVVRGVPLQVYNTHLQHNDADERMEQVEAIKGLIGTPDDSVILLGDLNARPDAPEIAAILENLVDTWEDAGLGDGYTYPSDGPDRRIDYVLRSDDVITRTAAVVATDASDHLPVYADVLLPGSKVGVGRRG